MSDVRIDKWLWAARFFKTRSLAQTAIDTGKVVVGGERVKLSRHLRIGEQLTIRIGEHERVVEVLGLSDQRGPAPVAQKLYAETPESIRKRVEETARRVLYSEPGQTIEHGRPTKRERRDLDRWRTRDD